MKKTSKIIFLALACAIINGNSISAYAENLIEKSVQTETISIETEIAEIAETEETIENGQGMIDGFVTEGNKTYYYYAGEKLTGHQEIEGKRYYFEVATGAMFKGERVESGHWVYYSEVDGTLATGWTEHHGKCYFYDENGWMMYGKQKIDGEYYFFNQTTGVMFTGERVENGHWVYYSKEDGTLATGWTEHNGKRYYYDENGWMMYGKQKIDGKYYFFDQRTGVMFKGERVENGHWVYYSKEDGTLATGWTEHNGKRYYYNENGWMMYGKQKIDGKYYFFNQTTGVMFKGERVENGHWVYYSEKDGTLTIGWSDHNGNRYYYDKNGWMVYGKQTINGEIYIFHPVTGVLINVNGIRKLDPNKPMIALTFDDGPSSYTSRILDKLEEYGQAATFFVVGYNAKRYTSTIKRAYSLGCEIGNHTYNHPDLTEYSYSGIVNELASVDTIIYNATGKYSTVMRPPYGSYNSTVRNASDTPIILWSVDTMDWNTRDTWSTVNSVMNNAEDGAIVLMHDIYSQTASAAEILIPKLVQKGFQLVTVTELAYYKGNGMKNGSVYFEFY